jgi:hypothetical protein
MWSVEFFQLMVVTLGKAVVNQLMHILLFEAFVVLCHITLFLAAHQLNQIQVAVLWWQSFSSITYPST